jgi:hypothetical protein
MFVFVGRGRTLLQLAGRRQRAPSLAAGAPIEREASSDSERLVENLRQLSSCVLVQLDRLTDLPGYRAGRGPIRF